MRTGSGAKIRLALAGATALTLAIPPNYGTPPSGGGGGGGPLTVADFPRDYLIYDSGGAVGLGYATVPVSGTGPVGAEIEARAASTALSGDGTTAWSTIATVGGAGTYIGTLDVPLTRPWLKIETRIKTAPITVASTTNRFAVGLVCALWGQSEIARCWVSGINTMPKQALVTIKQQVQNLANPGQCGRTSRNPLNIASPTNLPPGGSISGGLITISGTQTIRDWSFTDYRVQFGNNAVLTIEQCVFNVTLGSTTTWLNYALVGSRTVIRDCDYLGPSGSISLDAAVKEQQTAVGSYGKVTLERCKFLGLSADALKLVAGSARWCWGKWVKNTDAVGPILPWSNVTTYNIGDHCSNASGNVFKSLINGNLNIAPPTSKTSTANWQNIDPHVDCVTVEKSDEPVFIEYCNWDMSELVLANGGTGGNNYVRFQPNSGTSSFQNVHVRYCVCDRDPTAASFPYHVTGSFLGQAYFTGIWHTAKNSGSNPDINPESPGSIHWAGVKDLATDALRPLPAGVIDESASFVEENTDYTVQQAYHDRNVIGSGAAGVQYVPETASGGHTSSFRAMANTFLLELCGYKVMVLHQTQSGTGTAELTNDSDPDRLWVDDQALHDFGTVGGATVGVAGGAWNSSNAGMGLNISIAYYELITKKNWTTGATLNKPFNYPSTDPTQGTADHAWGDIYNLTKTRWMLIGPNSSGGSGMNSLRFFNNQVASVHLNYMRHSISHRDMMLDARSVGVFSKRGPLVGFKTGQTFNNGTNFDYSHPDCSHIDGGASYLSQYAHAFMQAAGFRKWEVPELDNVFWASDGSYAEVWSSAGDVTTWRKQRGLADLVKTPGTTDHWTDVWGFEWCVGSPNLVNGSNLVTIDDALLVNADGSGTPAIAGRVRLFKPGGGTWAVGDTIVQGLGMATGVKNNPADLDNGCYMNTPQVFVGAIGADQQQVGIRCRPLMQYTRP